MRGSRAKLLRRIAERYTQGMPKATYVLNKNRKRIELAQVCTRYFYKKLKKDVLQEIRNGRYS